MNLHTNLDLTKNSAQKSEKLWEKVAETAEISKTAPKNSAQKPENCGKK